MNFFPLETWRILGEFSLWAGDRTTQEAWGECERGDWMLVILTTTNSSPKIFGQILQDFHDYDGETDPEQLKYRVIADITRKHVPSLSVLLDTCEPDAIHNLIK